MMIPTMSYAYIITGKVENLLLTENDMAGFRLKSQVSSMWLTSEHQVIKGIEQTWASNTNYGEDVMVDICLLNSIQLANKCTHLTRIETSNIFSWGSYKGQFLGEKLWVGANNFKNMAFLFIKYNVAVRVGMVKCETEQIVLIESVAEKVLNKIDSKKSRKPSREYERAKSIQIPEAKFERIILGAMESVLKNFRIERKNDAMWLIDSDGHFKYGRQWEWQIDDGPLVGISICQFQNPDEARKGAELRKIETYGYIVEGDFENPRIPPDINNFGYVSSVIFVKGSMVSHIYQYNKKGVDVGLFESLVAKISPNL